jgi:transposase
MIDYATFCKIHSLSKEGLTTHQIAAAVALHVKTVQRWVNEESFAQRKTSKRSSLLDPYKATIVRLLQQHEYSSVQVMQKIQEAGYTGGATILKDYVRVVRPPSKPAFLMLSFDPGECGQVDWGSAGRVQVGNTQRRLSFFVMVLAYSRMMYVEFVLSEAQDQFLRCHERAFEYFGGVPKSVMIDNLKAGVLSHPLGEKAIFHPKYIDFANHYGFEISACNVRAPNEKGRVENGVGYVKKNFLNGLKRDCFDAINPAARIWLDTIANPRIHGTTHKKPVEMFKEERPKLLPLTLRPYDVGSSRPITVNSQFRITFETNTYSVPAEYASKHVLLRTDPDTLRIYHEHNLIAEHIRTYDRRLDHLNPDHQRRLLQQKRKARDQQHLKHLMRLSPHADEYVRQLQHRRLNPAVHIRKIIALSEIYGEKATARAIEDAIEFHAYSSEYIENILHQRSQNHPEPSALHLIRNEDLLDIELPAPDLTIYTTPQEPTS